MLLEELLSIITDGERVNVLDEDGGIIAFYDGKNSIPVELNGQKVLAIYEDENEFNIVICTDGIVCREFV